MLHLPLQLDFSFSSPAAPWGAPRGESPAPAGWGQPALHNLPLCIRRTGRYHPADRRISRTRRQSLGTAAGSRKTL